MSRAADWFRLVRFSHSVFALPFALISALLAARGLPPWSTLGWILLCCVAARTAAMGFNRLVDRGIDARNPRTAARELPAGRLAPAAVAALVVLCSALFIAAAWRLGPLCGWLAPLVLAVLLGYSYAKRFTALAHLWLGLALGLAPLGAWLAVRGSLEGGLAAPLLLSAAVIAWVAGFDVLYACQDCEFDRRAGLHSIPARLGIARALRVSELLHVLAFALLAAFAVRGGLSYGTAFALALAGALLYWQHRLVRPDDLSRLDLAFFTLNGWVGFVLLLGVSTDLWLRGGAA
ncbi:MAG: 4-hydroxybenzoate octaprenyltransferase [Planctomycetes bacterium]|nr:4-hydroxybenzoate octaprenyltransferase [Planctomycetota bacterium]